MSGLEGGERNQAAPSSPTNSPIALGKATSVHNYDRPEIDNVFSAITRIDRSDHRVCAEP